jgi:hypothetical protein
MSVIVSQGNSPYKVSSGHTDSGDVVISAAKPPIRRYWRIPTSDDARAGPGYADPQSRRLTSVRYS